MYYVLFIYRLVVFLYLVYCLFRCALRGKHFACPPTVLNFTESSEQQLMHGLYYHFNNLRFNNSLDINDSPIHISKVFLCFK